MPWAPPPSAAHKGLRFSGKIDYGIEPGLDDWGLTCDQQEAYVERFRQILAAKNAWRHDEHDFYKLRRFLRARSYDLEKATAMWMKHLAWRHQLKVDTVLHDFVYHEKERLLQVYPQGYHKTDKQGRPVYIQNIGAISIEAVKRCTTEERLIRFHIQEYERAVKVVMPVCSKLQQRNIDTTFGIMDVRGIGVAHLTGETKRLLGIITQLDQDNYPEMLGHICIINAPTMFRFVWSIVKSFLDARTQEKIEILGSDYKDGLLKWIDADSLPVSLGGRSQGSLFDDVGPWSDSALLAALGIDLEALRNAPPYRSGVPREDGGSSTAGRGAAVTNGPAGMPAVHAGAPAASVGPSSPAAAAARASPRHLQRAPSDSASEGGYYSPTGSASDLSRVGSNLQATLAELRSSTIPEGPSKTLLERIEYVERLLPNQASRLRSAASASEEELQSLGEGSLLNRVEVLEAAMERLLLAQAAMLRDQQQLLTQQSQQQQQHGLRGIPSSNDAPRQQQVVPKPPRRARACCGCCVQ